MMKSKSKGVLMVVSGPAGVGKGTVCDVLAADCEDIFLSVSVTSRAPRGGEVDGVHYYYKSKELFEEMIKKNQLIEYNQYVNGNYYGTPAAPIDARLENGDSVILEIDVEGGKQIKEKRPDAVMVFVVPPSFEELERRLRGRETESEADIKARLTRAKVEFELSKSYDYIVVNDTVENAVKTIEAIITAEKRRTFRCVNAVYDEIKTNSQN